MLLSNSEFLSQLEALFAKQRTTGSVFITSKRYTYVDGDASKSHERLILSDDVEMLDSSSATRPIASTSAVTPRTMLNDVSFSFLIRATDGNDKKSAKVKLSTLVQPAAFSSFTQSYTLVLKFSLTPALRKRKLRLKKRTMIVVGSTTSAAAGGATKRMIALKPRLPKIVGPRRGAGASKRKRSLKARAKLQQRRKEKGRVMASDRGT